MMQLVKNPPANVRYARDVDSIPGSGRSHGEGHGNPIQNSCLKNPMDRGAWWPTVHEIAKSWILLSTHTHTHTHTHDTQMERKSDEDRSHAATRQGVVRS